MRVERFLERTSHHPAADKTHDLANNKRKDCGAEDRPGVPIRPKSGQQRHPEAREGEATGHGTHWKH